MLILLPFTIIVLLPIFMLIDWLKKRRKPECPAWAMGYKCKENRPGGCPDCGRGRDA